ncbi:hypothetical protein [Nocardioides solisilvae]|uniref:hypothetical protein n=1 Tax=Nocardioides solisilvae TaxID=1542435 RepID=UPI0013A52D61|nr:hypothetical protein [Nocardioides solisilvae]
MAEQVPAVGNVLALIERRDWVRLERALAPDVHWTTAIEEQLHGSAAVVALLRTDPVPGPPAYHEVDGRGRVVRWIDKMG